MSNKMNITETISELDRISSLWDQMQAINEAANAMTDGEERDAELKYLDTLEKFKAEQNKSFTVRKPEIAADCLTMPPTSLEQPDFTNIEIKIIIGALSGLVALGSLVLYVLFAVLGFHGPIDIIAYILFGSGILWLFKGSNDIVKVSDWQEKYRNWDDKQKQWEASFNKVATKENTERFLNEFKEYDSSFTKLIEEWSKKRNEEFSILNTEIIAIRQKKIDKLNQLQEELSEITGEFDKVTLIHSDLFGYAHSISSMLKLGRADTLKEAINLVLEEERKDMEEAARRAEARQQEAILEQQAMDNRMHNAAMERAANEQALALKSHNAAMERAAVAQAQAMQSQAQAMQSQARAAQEQAKENARQASIAKKQANDAEAAAWSRCLNCANRGKCSSSAKKALSCGGYRPK